MATETPWITWAGGHCPVKHSQKVEVRYRDGETDIGTGKGYSAYINPELGDWWQHEGNDISGHGCDIVAYRAVR